MALILYTVYQYDYYYELKHLIDKGKIFVLGLKLINLSFS